jgi:hypothetical protein
VFAVVVLGVSSCSRKEEAPLPPPIAKPKPVEPKTLTGSWRDTYFHVKGDGLKSEAQLRLLVVGGVLHLTAADLPIGTKLEAEGVSYEKTKEFDTEGLTLSLERRLADASWDELKERKSKVGKWTLPPQVDWQIPVTMTVPGFAPLATTLPAFGISARLEDVFSALARTEKSWPDEVTGPAPAAAAWAFNGFEAMGDAAKTRDVRLVVLGEMTENSRTRRCTGYVGAPDFTATSYDVELQLVDRSSKQPVAKKKFLGQPACPRTVLSGPSNPPAHAEGPDSDVMRGWVLAQLKPLAKTLR